MERSPASLQTEASKRGLLAHWYLVPFFMPAFYRFLWRTLGRYRWWKKPVALFACSTLFGNNRQKVFLSLTPKYKKLWTNKWMHMHFLKTGLQIKLPSSEENPASFKAVSYRRLSYSATAGWESNLTHHSTSHFHPALYQHKWTHKAEGSWEMFPV